HGSGKDRIPDRALALDLLEVVPSVEEACLAIAGPVGREGLELWTTAATARSGPVTSFADARRRLVDARRPVRLTFGPGWGIPEELLRRADVRLEPIRACHDRGYNHLSVRAACAISLDRLLGP